MTSFARLVPVILLPLAALVAVAAPAQQALLSDDVGEARQALSTARQEGAAARQRAERLEGEARRASQAAEKTAREAAALAARIQQTQAEIAGHEATIRVIGGEQRQLRTRLAEKQQPVARLLAALQRLSRRPPALALLRPGSLADTMHMRALLATLIPEVERRTADLRAEIGRARALERRARLASTNLRRSQTALEARRRDLAALETRQRLAEREAGGVASREAERALALAEEARDLGTLVGELGRAGELREALARLPGPVLRPPRPEDARVIEAEDFTVAPRGLGNYLLPVSGRLVAGFGEAGPGNTRANGISLATRPGAQAVAPAAGRVAFAGPYRGYGSIVIIEHEGGWTSLVTGLIQLDTGVGEKLVAGSPLGIVGTTTPVVQVELRHQGEPVNPLQFVRPL